MLLHLLLLFLLTVVIDAMDHTIIVAENEYKPPNITAIAGDTITFKLFILSHLLRHLIVLNIM